MPWHVSQTSQCPASQPWGVIKTETGEVVPGGCHETEAEAQAHKDALYASESGAEMSASDGGCGCEQRDRAARASVDNSPWDATAAMSKCATSASPASCYESICAGRKAGDAALQLSWALPHHKTAGGPANADGVRFALSRLPQTDGLTNREQAQRHLERHMSEIHGQQDSASAQAAQARAQAAQEDRLEAVPAAKGRRLAFQPQLEIRKVERDGQEFYHLQGTATVYEQPYVMLDIFGEYREVVSRRAGASSLAKNPDVTFLANHEGLSLARTTNGTLEIREDDAGLHYDAYLNPKRFDVRDLVAAVEDKTIDESSFAFRIDNGSWNDDFTEFRINAYNIERGDVSAVNYGANPWTSVAARQQPFLAELDRAPAWLARAVLHRLQHRADVAASPAPPAEQTGGADAASRQRSDAGNDEVTGISVELVRARLAVLADE